MAHTNVSSCVLSIVGSFATGLDVFKKLREKRRRKRRSTARGKKDEQSLDEEEQKLSRSLRQGPEDIGREYQKSVHAAGDQYAVGDAIAQTCLAEILLKLNTGLVGIIAAFLNTQHASTANVRIDYQALTDLSERSRVETCRTLRQLFRRLTKPSPRGRAPDSREHFSQSKTSSDRRNRSGGKKEAEAAYTKVRGPMLARVVVQNSSRPSQIAMVKPGERRKKSLSSSSAGASAVSKASSDPATSAPLTPLPPYTVEPSPEQQQRPSGRRSHTAPSTPQPRHRASTANLPRSTSLADNILPATQSTSRLADPSTHLAPPHPSTAPLLPSQTFRRRRQTPTYYSMASDGTQLGEIPLHKWAEPVDFDRMSMLNRQALLEGWPVNQMREEAEGSEVIRKRGFGFGRLFGRK